MRDDKEIVAWLLEGDPAIRWQAMRDLTGAGPAAVARERERVASQGWGARLLAEQGASGRWSNRLYHGKWISTTYSLMLLRRMGLPPDHSQAQPACRELLEGGFCPGGGISYAKSAERIDLVKGRRRRDGRWPLQNRHRGKSFFEMERAGKPSRCNTLRGLRVLKWWGEG